MVCCDGMGRVELRVASTCSAGSGPAVLGTTSSPPEVRKASCGIATLDGSVEMGQGVGPSGEARARRNGQADSGAQTGVGYGACGKGWALVGARTELGAETEAVALRLG